MKVTVCFNSVRVIVPCGNGDLTVSELIERAVSRYRKATNKPADECIQVHFLETSDDHGILDSDDTLSDVVDDKDKLLAVFEEGAPNRPTQNGGYGTSASSIGTASPDLSQDELPNTVEEPATKSYTPVNNRTEYPKEELQTFTSSSKSPPPPVPPKPSRQKSNNNRSLYIDSVPSEDSGISTLDDRFRIGSDSSKSEINETSIAPSIRMNGETTFVAIGTPVKTASYNDDGSDVSRRRFSSTSSDHADNEHSDEETFSLGRNMARKSMFVDSPMLDRWAELQEERLYQANGSREPTSVVTSPSEPSSNEPDFSDKDHEDARSESSESSGEPDTLTIELKRYDPLEPLGFTVAGYRTADGRELGLIVRNISPTGCAARDGRLQIADRIVEVNGWNLVDLPNERAEELFAAASKATEVKVCVSHSHSFVPGEQSDEPVEEDNSRKRENIEDRDQSAREILTTPSPSFIHSPPSISDTSFKKVNKRILIELNKGNDGLGFSITTRDNPAGGNTPIFVKSILPNGAAIEDGRLRSGDQILEVNECRMTGKSQSEAVNVLRSTRGLVRLLIQREEMLQSPQTSVQEVNEDSLRSFREDGLQVLTFKIRLEGTGAAGLGVTVKGKSRAPGEEGRDSPQDKGIFVKSVITGGAAAKDGRLRPDDQLLRINNQSLVGLTNSASMETLKQAMQSTKSYQAFIDVTVAREQEDQNMISAGAHGHSGSLEALNAPDQERPIEAGPELKPVEGFSEVDGGVRHKERHPSGDDDQFNETSVNLNMVSLRARNAVHRNDSYCVAVNKSHSPDRLAKHLRQRLLQRPSPLAMGNDRGQPRATSSPTMASTPVGGRSEEAALVTTRSVNIPSGRPISTVGLPTPLMESTDNGSLGSGSSSTSSTKGPPPTPPPRWDSAVDNPNNGLPARHKLRLDIKGAQERGASFPMPPPPPQFSNQSPVKERSLDKELPSYDQAVARLGRSPVSSVSSDPFSHISSREERRSWASDNEDLQIIAPPSPFSSEENPFQRDGFGRQSMSEKRGRGSLDARQSELFNRRERERNGDDTSEESDKEDEYRGSLVQQYPLRKADSEELLRQQLNNGLEAKRTSEPPMGRLQKSISTGQLKHIGVQNVEEKRSKSKSNDNLSFTSAVERANNTGAGGEMANGHARFSQSEEEVPITMRSNADFTAVQQKLAVKKPFYKGIGSVFKIGKGRRGDYNLSDNEGPSFKHTYNKEALIDFPAEQRYRQLVNHYESTEQPSTLPTRGRKKHEAKDRETGERRAPPMMKVGRVTVTAPTRV